jgi:hypothetical protein
LENKFRFEKKVKHLKSIDQSSKGKGYDGKSFKKKWKSFKKTLRKMEKKLQWNTKAHYYRVLPKGDTKLRRSFGRKI